MIFKMRNFFTILLTTIFLILRAKAQTLVTQPLMGSPLPGDYYSPTSIILMPNLNFTPSGIQKLHLYITLTPPDCSTLNNNFSTAQNYILTITPRIPAYSTTGTYTSCDIMQTVQYFDGLGRPLQTVQVKGSPGNNDMVNPTAYDQFGRQVTKYLPYTLAGTAVSDGSYKSTALADQQAFYDPAGSTGTQLPGDIALIPTPHADVNYEPSPLNRVLEQGAPGDAWQLTGTANASGVQSGHTLKTIYTSNDNVHYFAIQYSVGIGTKNNNPTLIANGNYGVNQLYVTVTQNENWSSSGQADPRLNTTEEYKDKEGHVILKRTYVYTTIYNTNAVLPVSTYYVYDDLGNLTYVLTPQSIPDQGLTSASNQNALNSLCYQYTYDYRNRMITKQLPGKGVEAMVYNLLDQVIYTQDANQLGRNEWAFNKYDALGRVIMTGIETANSSAASDLQNTVISAITAGTYTQWETTSPGSGVQGFSNTAFPNSANVVPLTVNYYDDYTFTGQPSTCTMPTGASTMTNGLLTATKTAVLNTMYNVTPDMLWTVHYYDDLGRVTQNFRQHYLGGILSPYNYDVVMNNYDFTNEIVTSTRQHYGANSGKTAPSLNATVVNNYTYDHMGRKKQTFEQINGGANVLLSQLDYNEIGPGND